MEKFPLSLQQKENEAKIIDWYVILNNYFMSKIILKKSLMDNI